jgi:hypothetical protein
MRGEATTSLQEALGADLAHLVTGLDCPVVEVALITGLPSAWVSRARAREVGADRSGPR